VSRLTLLSVAILRIDWNVVMEIDQTKGKAELGQLRATHR